MNPQPTPASDRIFAPNVYLCAYSLRDERIQGDNYPLWHYCDVILNQFTPEKLTPHLDFSQTDNGPSRQILLPNQSDIPFTLTDSPEIEGYVQPWQIHDSYAVLLNVGYDDENPSLPEVAVNHLKTFTPHIPLLLPKYPQFLGQTLILTAYLTPELKQQYRQSLDHLVHCCYQSLISPNSPPISRQGELFGSPIFEYGKISDPDESPHVLIWLFRDKETDRLLQTCFYSIFDLLFYRSKIIRAFHDSRHTYGELTTYYRELDPFLDRLQDKLDTANPDAKDDAYLDDFKAQLKHLSSDTLQYSRLLGKMKDFTNTIEINLYNYKERIEEICAKLGIDKEELSFLKHFGEETAPHLRTQIKADLGYFEQGTKLMDQAIASIRGIVEIDQAKRDRLRLEQEKQRDRNLETLIYVISAGLAGAGIAASSSGYLTAGSETGEMTIQWMPDFNQPLHPFTKVLGISIAIGFLLGFVVWLIRQGIQLVVEKGKGCHQSQNKR
ncbi:hypothetical protein NG796_22975 [Laspinema sp. A4]|uniref:hypothetical protein n=1 Tax=Laspinema sp. D2d TaxID=2953686 RepID=UPI0021BB9EAF|nr:hypothetical protein [Laspinema sp. D2d]MCT7986140.1 hypothetical protein [Laspinema sp. D2d]